MTTQPSVPAPIASHCPACGIPFVFGSIVDGSAGRNKKALRLKRVFGMDEGTSPHECDGIWMGEAGYGQPRRLCKRCGEIVRLF